MAVLSRKKTLEKKNGFAKKKNGCINFDVIIKLKFTCSKSTIGTLERG